MDQLLAKIKRNQKPLKLLSDQKMYTVDFGSISFVDFAPDHNLDEDSWFKINVFSQKPYCLDLLKRDFVSSEYNDLPSDKFKDISYLLAVQDDAFYFQKVTPSMLLTRKFLNFGENVSFEQDSKRLVVKDIPDAIYRPTDDSLIFRNIATIASIFKGIDTLYKEATNEEVTTFLDEEFVNLSGDYGVDNVSKPNRKRIALALSTLDSMSSQDRDDIFTYIHSYCDEKLNCDPSTNSIEVTTDEELKYLLYGIEQRFYTTPLGQEKRLANSVQKL